MVFPLILTQNVDLNISFVLNIVWEVTTASISVSNIFNYSILYMIFPFTKEKIIQIATAHMTCKTQNAFWLGVEHMLIH